MASVAPKSATVPPTLPPSVEEAYKRKCAQLKTRMNEIEEANDIARMRLLRVARVIEKMRLERAFLLEQLARRTSTNVEDSEGSPSPPPTPNDKPLRSKRGHRKPSFLNETPVGPVRGTFSPPRNSPIISTFSHSPHAVQYASPQTGHPGVVDRGGPDLRIYIPQPPPQSGFELFCVEQMPAGGGPQAGKDVEKQMAEIWDNMTEKHRTFWDTRLENFKSLWDQGLAKLGTENENAPGDDVEMGEPPLEVVAPSVPAPAPAPAPVASGGGGFTAVNRP